MSITSTFAPSTSINNIKNLTYNILKTFKDGIIKSKKFTKLEHCSVCKDEIISHFLKAFTTLSCGHGFHRICIKKKLLLTIPNTCSFSGCSEEVKIIETEHRRGSESSTSLVVRRIEKHNQSTISSEKESHKRPNEDITKNKLSDSIPETTIRKKKKNLKDFSPI
ncbi:21663_t:CDS:2, partial [Cetraspora pellucida]